MRNIWIGGNSLSDEQAVRIWVYVSRLTSSDFLEEQLMKAGLGWVGILQCRF